MKSILDNCKGCLSRSYKECDSCLRKSIEQLETQIEEFAFKMLGI